ncbi:hypothetical protein N7471_009354 [Penicillium samsonianum]|uniref:uncharacterized protein n=1 Tax=Penicillium samsonianum TaxID=1882272 RepID=UPI00254844A8|nr:uncharacterized protein N7471_009354 [Penicillium samsonianum]KAJ6128137.1 hypothetical protein N7471_009354 [Penicillium samsonianum]
MPRSGDDSIIIGHGPDQLAVLAAEDGGANGVAEAADSLGELDLGLPDVLAESLELVDVEGGLLAMAARRSMLALRLTIPASKARRRVTQVMVGVKAGAAAACPFMLVIKAG